MHHTGRSIAAESLHLSPRAGQAQPACDSLDLDHLQIPLMTVMKALAVADSDAAAAANDFVQRLLVRTCDCNKGMCSRDLSKPWRTSTDISQTAAALSTELDIVYIALQQQIRLSVSYCIDRNKNSDKPLHFGLELTGKQGP